MPPWAAVQGYGQFANDNSLTLRETQFIVSWVEGLGPRNAGTVFTNVVSSSARPPAISAHVDFGVWQLGEPDLKRPLSCDDDRRPPGERNRADGDRSRIDLDRRVPGSRISAGDAPRGPLGSLHGAGNRPSGWEVGRRVRVGETSRGSAYRLPAGSHVVADIHTGARAKSSEWSRARSAYFTDQATLSPVSDLVLGAKGEGVADRGAQRLRAETCLATDTFARGSTARRPERRDINRSVGESSERGHRGLAVRERLSDGLGQRPTSLQKPVMLRKGTTLSVTAYGSPPLPGKLRLTVSRY
jgi:hypothetical protein